MFLTLLALCLQAAPTAEQAWPRHAAEAKFGSVQTAALPEQLRAAMKRWDEFIQGKNTLPESLKVARVDLNGDHVDEFIVQSQQTYSAGPRIFVFESTRDGSFSTIAGAQGTIYFGPRVNGYFEIVCQSRAGGGEYTRTLQRYDGGEYRLVRIADYREAEPGGPLQFVRQRGPQTLKGLGSGRETTLTEPQKTLRDTKLRQVREIEETKKDSPTIQEFLGGHVKDVTVTNVNLAFGAWSTAEKSVNELLSSLLIQPHSDGPFAYAAWSELADAMITATIHYDDGRVGRLETDGRAHLFVEDHEGIAWWYRWDPSFPRVSRK